MEKRANLPPSQAERLAVEEGKRQARAESPVARIDEGAARRHVRTGYTPGARAQGYAWLRGQVGRESVAPRPSRGYAYGLHMGPPRRHDIAERETVEMPRAEERRTPPAPVLPPVRMRSRVGPHPTGKWPTWGELPRGHLREDFAALFRSRARRAHHEQEGKRAVIRAESVGADAAAASRERDRAAHAAGVAAAEAGRERRRAGLRHFYEEFDRATLGRAVADWWYREGRDAGKAAGHGE